MSKLRRLEKGEIIEGTDWYKDGEKLVRPTCIGQSAPDPSFTSHREYYRDDDLHDDSMNFNWGSYVKIDRYDALQKENAELLRLATKLFKGNHLNGGETNYLLNLIKRGDEG